MIFARCIGIEIIQTWSPFLVVRHCAIFFFRLMKQSYWKKCLAELSGICNLQFTGDKRRNLGIFDSPNIDLASSLTFMPRPRRLVENLFGQFSILLVRFLLGSSVENLLMRFPILLVYNFASVTTPITWVKAWATNVHVHWKAETKNFPTSLH